jgi:hypothetical protein
MSSRRTSLVLFFVLLGLIHTGCAKLVKTLSDAGKLQGEITRQYGEKNVHVNVFNDAVLTVTFTNSPLNGQTRDVRAQRAQATAEFIKGHYAGINSIKEIWVRFARQQTRYLIVTFTEDAGSFGFDKNARPLFYEGLPTNGSDSELTPMVTFSPQRQQTDISIRRLPLEGDLDDGLTMVVNFTVAGDATGLRRAAAPEFVNVDFASYAPKPRFPGKIKIKLIADDAVVHEIEESFSTSKTMNGGFSEFLMLQVPYAGFRNWTKGNKITVSLGAKNYALTTKQSAALHKLTEYVRK